MPSTIVEHQIGKCLQIYGLHSGGLNEFDNAIAQWNRTQPPRDLTQRVMAIFCPNRDARELQINEGLLRFLNAHRASAGILGIEARYVLDVLLVPQAVAGRQLRR